MKFLGSSHVTKDITIHQFNGVVTNITAESFLGFDDNELPTKGIAHNKALYILMKCMDTIMSRVLVDTRSSLNIMLKITLMKLTLEGVSLKPYALIVKAFNGSRRAVIG